MSNRTRSAFTVTVTCTAVAVASAVWIARSYAKDEPKPAAAKADAQPASPEAAMAEWEKIGKPGKEHERLKPLAGEFEADVKMWMAPGQPAQTSKGKEKSEMVLDGRFLQSHYEGQMMGKPFRGQMLFGYDNQKKKYVATWVDSTMTGIMMAEGTADDAGKVFTLHSEMTEPDGKKQKVKQVTTIVDDKTHTYQMMIKLPDGGEFKVLEITYKRVK